MVVHRHLVVELRAVWRCVAYDDGVVGCERVVGWERGWMRAGLVHHGGHLENPIWPPLGIRRKWFLLKIES